MAQTLIRSREALDDIDAIAEYISRDSIFYANQVVERLLQLGESLVLADIHGRRLLESDERF